MGEAKRRGSKAERAVEAQMRDAIPTAIQDLISRLGLPSGSRFLGYVVHVPSTDDYLANVDAMDGMVRRAYTPSPAHAQVFHDFHNAVSAANEVPKEAIELLPDSGTAGCYRTLKSQREVGVLRALQPILKILKNQILC